MLLGLRGRHVSRPDVGLFGYHPPRKRGIEFVVYQAQKKSRTGEDGIFHTFRSKMGQEKKS